MTNKQLHDFLLKEVEGFVLEATSQIVESGECVPAEVLLDSINETQNELDIRIAMLSMMLNAVGELKCDIGKLQNDIDGVVEMPRFNNDNILLFLQRVQKDVKEKFHSIAGVLLADMLEEIIRKMMMIPASVINGLPEELNTPEAIALLDKARKEGLLDQDYKPVKRYKDYVYALLAKKIATLLKFPPNNFWAPFVKYWGMPHLRIRFKSAELADGYDDAKKNIDRLYR